MKIIVVAEKVDAVHIKCEVVTGTNKFSQCYVRCKSLPTIMNEFGAIFVHDC